MTRSEKDKRGLMLIGGVLVAVIALVVVREQVQGRGRSGDDNCLGSPSASTVVIIDRSEQSSGQTTAEIRARALAHIRDSVRENELVTIFSIDSLTKGALAPLVSLCRPPEGNRLTQNVKSLHRRFQENFERPIEAALAHTQGTSAESPLAQAITDISLSRYLRSEKNTLIVFSDMLENTEAFSLYRCESPTKVIEEYRSSRMGAKVRPRFINTMITLNIIPRLGQTKAMIDCRDRLWTWFFGDDPGSEAGLRRDDLPGGSPVQPAAAR